MNNHQLNQLAEFIDRLCWILLIWFASGLRGQILAGDVKIKFSHQALNPDAYLARTEYSTVRRCRVMKRRWNDLATFTTTILAV